MTATVDNARLQARLRARRKPQERFSGSRWDFLLAVALAAVVLGSMILLTP